MLRRTPPLQAMGQREDVAIRCILVQAVREVIVEDASGSSMFERDMHPM